MIDPLIVASMVPGYHTTLFIDDDHGGESVGGTKEQTAEIRIYQLPYQPHIDIKETKLRTTRYCTIC